MSRVVKSDYDYYNNPDRILIGVDINTHIDLFEDAYSQYAGKPFDWDKDQDDFNRASNELDNIVENVFAGMFGHMAVEEFHNGDDYGISQYCCTFWGDKNNPNDIKVLQELQNKADDTWVENDRMNVAIYDEGVYGGPDGLDSFVEKWDELGAALAGSITVGVDFPEEFDADPMYDNVNGLHTLKNSRQIKSAKSDYDKGSAYAEDMYQKYVEGGINAEDIAAPSGSSDEFCDGFNDTIIQYNIKSSRQIKSGYTGTNVSVEYGPYGEEKEFPFFDMKGMTDEEIDDKLGYYEEVGAHWGSDGESYMILEDHAYAEDKIAVIEDDYLEWQERYYG